MSRPICTPHFDDISQSTAELLLLPVYEKGRPPYWNSTSGSEFDLFIIMGMAFCIGILISSKSVNAWWSYDVMSIFQDVGCRVGKLIPA